MRKWYRKLYLTKEFEEYKNHKSGKIYTFPVYIIYNMRNGDFHSKAKASFHFDVILKHITLRKNKIKNKKWALRIIYDNDKIKENEVRAITRLLTRKDQVISLENYLDPEFK